MLSGPLPPMSPHHFGQAIGRPFADESSYECALVAFLRHRPSFSARLSLVGSTLPVPVFPSHAAKGLPPIKLRAFLEARPHLFTVCGRGGFLTVSLASLDLPGHSHADLQQIHRELVENQFENAVMGSRVTGVVSSVRPNAYVIVSVHRAQQLEPLSSTIGRDQLKVFVSFMDIAPSIQPRLWKDAAVALTVHPSSRPGSVYKHQGHNIELLAQLPAYHPLPSYPTPMHSYTDHYAMSRPTLVQQNVPLYTHTLNGGGMRGEVTQADGAARWGTGPMEHSGGRSTDSSTQHSQIHCSRSVPINSPSHLTDTSGMGLWTERSREYVRDVYVSPHGSGMNEHRHPSKHIPHCHMRPPRGNQKFEDLRNGLSPQFPAGMQQTDHTHSDFLIARSDLDASDGLEAIDQLFAELPLPSAQATPVRSDCGPGKKLQSHVNESGQLRQDMSSRRLPTFLGLEDWGPVPSSPPLSGSCSGGSDLSDTTNSLFSSFTGPHADCGLFSVGGAMNWSPPSR